MERIWSGATFNCSMEGNIQRAESLEPRARIFAGFLLDQLGGLRIYTQGELREPDGSTIEAYVWKDMLGERAMVRIVGAPVVGGLQEEIRIEHGWLTKLDNTWPIYTWPELSTYLRQKGTVVDEDGMYKSVLERSERNDITGYPSLYSGLTRLFIQARIGCNYKIQEMLPDGWLAAPQHLGCIRSPKGVYWLTNASSNGIFAVRLRPSDAIVEIAGLAEAKLVPPDEQIFIDAFVLANQEVVYVGGEPDIEVLVSGDDEILQNYFEEYNTPIAWGWCWRYQMRGASDEYTAGACVSYGKGIVDYDTELELLLQSDYKKIKTLNLDIAWESDRPVAEITFDPVQEVLISALMRNSCLMVYFSDTLQNEMRRLFQREHLTSPAPEDYWTNGASARFLAWYAPDGEKHYLEIVYQNSDSVSWYDGDEYVGFGWGLGSLSKTIYWYTEGIAPRHFRCDGVTLNRPHNGKKTVEMMTAVSPEFEQGGQLTYDATHFYDIWENGAHFDGPEGNYPNSEILIICDTPGAAFLLATETSRSYVAAGYTASLTSWWWGVRPQDIDDILGLIGMLPDEISGIISASETQRSELPDPVVVRVPYKFTADGDVFNADHDLFADIRKELFLLTGEDRVLRNYSVPCSISYGGRKIVSYAHLDADILPSAAQEKGTWIGGV